MTLNEVAKQLFHLSDGGHLDGRRFTQQELREHIRRMMQRPQSSWTLRCQTAFGPVRYHAFRYSGEASMITTYLQQSPRR